MNQTRSFLLIAWLVVAALLWLQWTQPPAPAPAIAPPPSTTAAPVASIPAALPSALPGPTVPATASTAAPTPVAPTSAKITLQNDVLTLTIDLQDARVVGAELRQYTVEKKRGSPTVTLLNADPMRQYDARSGLLQVDAATGERELAMTFHTGGDQSAFALTQGQAQVTVPLLWADPATGLSVRRELTLTRGSYVLGQRLLVTNAGSQTRRLYPFVELDRVPPAQPPTHSFMTNPESFSFVGAAWYSPADKFEKVAFADFAEHAPLNKAVTDGWIGMLQHHFVTAWVPAAGEAQVVSLASAVSGGMPVYRIRSLATPMDVASGTRQSRDSRLWIGPKLQAPLGQLAPSLELGVDYGYFTFIAQPLFWLLSWLHGLFGNWGWAIIAIVVLLKAALYWFSKKQYQSMARMRQLQPRLEALKERYGDDRQQYQMAMMELYKKEKINPLAGCLPVLIPMPIFLALYWVLVETVELRHAPWVGWIQNLTDADPYFILPALNLTVMYLTQKLTPTPGMDPMQKKMMQFMPLVFGVMMAFFPSGLVLYWVTNGLLGLLQQWWMTKQYALPPAAAK